jgi:methionyl-tRNA formyltransferase
VAERHRVPLLQPRRIKEPSALAALAVLAPELQVVVAYGQILPRPVIENARLGTVNVHASLLPRYRGAAPIQWAIARGESVTGVTTMLIDEGLDTGPTLLARATSIAPDETAAELEPRLARLGATLLIETLAGLASETLRPAPQDHSLATLAPLLHKEDGRCDWSWPAATLANRVRGLSPWPGVATALHGRSLKLLRTRAEPGGQAAPGTILEVDRHGILVACGENTCLRLLEVQPESRKPMPAAAFAAGARLLRGARFA